MNKSLVILVSIATLAMVDLAPAQYLPPGAVSPGYKWREERTQSDWRNNTWREERAKEDWRSNTWKEKRAKEDWRYNAGEDYLKDKTENSAAGTTKDREYDSHCGRTPAGSLTAPCSNIQSGKAPTTNPGVLPGVLLGPANK